MMKVSRSARVVFTCAATLTLGVVQVGPYATQGARADTPPPSDVTQAAPPSPLVTGTVNDTPDPRPRIASLAPAGPVAALPTGTWSPLGPAPVGPPFLQSGGFYGGANSGRVLGTAVLTNGTHPGRVVIASAGGGVWTSDDNGATWTPRTDGLTDPALAIGDVAAAPSNSDILVAGTGENNQSGDSFTGTGMLVSTNGGDTWSLSNPGGIFTNVKTSQVAFDPTNPNHAYVATSAGLFITTDLNTWAEPTDASYTTNVDGNVTSVVVDPTNPSLVYAGNVKTGVAKSTDGGATWAPANTGISVPGANVIPMEKLDIAKSSPSTLYLSIGSVNPVHVYKTTNSGGNWSALPAPDFTGQPYSYGSGSGEQGWYDNIIKVDPADPNHVVAGGIAVVETTDGGTTWGNVNSQPFFGGGTNKVHPDFHALAFRPDGKVWLGNDGGVYLYNNPGNAATSNITNANGNLNITQFYFGFNEVSGSILAGAQDNGSARTNRAVQAPWTGIIVGDGGPSAITPNDTNVQFSIGNQQLRVTTDAWASVARNITPPGSSGLFTPPILIIPNSIFPSQPTTFYGGDFLYRTTNPTSSSPTWNGVAVSPGFGFVSALASSPSNPSVVYVGFDDGNVMVSSNGGASFSPLTTVPFGDSFITGISVNPTDPNAITVSVSFNDTRYQIFGAPHVAQYSSGTWTVINGNLPTNAAVSHVVYDNGALLAATDQGVYGTGAPAGAGTAWSRIGTGLPFVQTQDLFVDSTTSLVYAVTHGRGAWVLGPAAGPDVTVTKKASPDPVETGTNLTYTMTASNTVAGTTAHTVTMTDATPAHTTFVSLTNPPGWSCTTPAVGGTGTVSCSIATLADTDGSQVFTLVVKVDLSTPTATTIDNTATVGASDDSNVADNSAMTSTGVTFPISLPGVVRSSTTWLLRNSLTSGPADTTFTYGTKPLVPLMGDWNGDGTKTAGTFEGGVFKLLNTNATPGGPPDITFTFGDPRGFPVAGDFNGDGIDDVAVYRNGLWQVHYLGTGAPPDTSFTFGSGSWPATVPLAGDWNGDGIDTVGVWSAGTFTLHSTITTAGTDTVFAYGAANGYPVVGDWNGDGIDTIGVRSGTTWSFRNTNSAGPEDFNITYQLATDLPMIWRKL